MGDSTIDVERPAVDAAPLVQISVLELRDAILAYRWACTPRTSRRLDEALAALEAEFAEMAAPLPALLSRSSLGTPDAVAALVDPGAMKPSEIAERRAVTARESGTCAKCGGVVQWGGMNLPGALRCRCTGLRAARESVPAELETTLWRADVLEVGIVTAIRTAVAADRAAILAIVAEVRAGSARRDGSPDRLSQIEERIRALGTP